MLGLRHLKAMVLVVGLLTIELELYVGFQTQEADAHPHTVIQSTVIQIITL